MMRYLLPILFILSCLVNVRGQDYHGMMEGSVTFITTQSVYVKFSSLEHMAEGDTLFVERGDSYIPALLIRNKSSMSCVCTPLLAREFNVSDVVYARPATKVIPETPEEEIVPDTTRSEETAGIDSISKTVPEREKKKQEIRGRVSVSSYSDLFSKDATRRQKMRYAFSLHSDHPGETGFSFDGYVTFSHSNTNWEEIRNNIFNGLKIYNLVITYDFSESMQICTGRKINPSLSSVGAIDGLQFTRHFGPVTLGAIAGSRPDYRDYSINARMVQFGAYARHDLTRKMIRMQNTLAFMEQTNRLVTDRRFLYVQHTSWLMKSLVLFGSAEMDLYKKVNGSAQSTFTFSNAYLSARYRIIKQLSLAVSYTSRQNIIYYETYKDFVERLLEKEALQGWQVRVNSRPVKNLVLGISGGYRYRKEDPMPSKHVYGYATYRQFPLIRTDLTISSTWLRSAYMSGNIYSIGLIKDLLPGRLTGGIKYRYVDYLYRSAETDIAQNIIETDISWLIGKKLSLSAYHEGTFGPAISYHRIYINLTRRF